VNGIEDLKISALAASLTLEISDAGRPIKKNKKKKKKKKKEAP